MIFDDFLIAGNQIRIHLGFSHKNHQARGSGDTSQADLLHAFRLLETQTSQQKHGAKGLQAKDKAVADAQQEMIQVPPPEKTAGGTEVVVTK